MMKFFLMPLLIVTMTACTTLQQQNLNHSIEKDPTRRVQKVVAPSPQKGIIAQSQSIVLMPEPELAVAPIPAKHFADAVGVVLPLSGAFQIYGQRTLAAMRLALEVESEQIEEEALVLKCRNGFSLIVMDDRGNSERAASLVEALVKTHQVSVVVGDILTETATAIAQKAQALGVINISLSRKEGLTQIGNGVFRMAMTAKKQVGALLSRVSNDAEMKRFAILYPQNNFGVEMRDAFVSEGKKRDILVVKNEGYRPDETTFTPYVRRLVGGKKTQGNASYEACIERANRLTDASARRKNANDCLESVAPNVPFDAIFIPDFPKNLGYIVPALISEGVMVSQDEALVRSYQRTSHNSSAKAVQMLGPSSWNNPALGEKLGVQIEGALFVEGGDLSEERPEVMRFASVFKDAQGSAPLLSEALAFDTIHLLENILRRGSHPEQIEKELLALEYTGVSGKISFDNERESVIPFRWFAFHEGKILPQS